MQTQLSSVEPAIRSSSTPMPTDEAIALKAGLTTAQMLVSGETAILTTQPLRDSVVLVSGSGGNVLVLPGEDGKLLIDSGLSTSKRQMAEALLAVSPDPLQLLINTHWHFDHTGGNEWMHAAGASILAHRKTLSRMQQEQAIPEFDGLYPPSPSGALPTETFEDKKVLRINGHELALTRYTPAHTETDIAVLFADADVLHTGDTFFSGLYPFIDYNSGGSIDGMIAACRETLALIVPSTIVVSGHGPAGTRGDLVSFEQMLAEMRERVARLKQSGASAEEVLSSKPSAPFDEKWGNGFVSPDLFTWLIYRGV